MARPRSRQLITALVLFCVVIGITTFTSDQCSSHDLRQQEASDAEHPDSSIRERWSKGGQYYRERLYSVWNTLRRHGSSSSVFRHRGSRTPDLGLSTGVVDGGGSLAWRMEASDDSVDEEVNVDRYSPRRELKNVETEQRNRARIAFLILSDGTDLGMLYQLLPQIYDPDNIYLLHVDAKTPPQKLAKYRDLVGKDFPGVEGGSPLNVRLIEPAVIVSWGGFSLTLASTYGMAVALQWDSEWDYFINISSADFPVLTQIEMKTVLGEYMDSEVSFMDGNLMKGFEKRWKGYVEDQSMQREASTHTKNAMTPLAEIQRPYPQLFSLYKGEYWMVLHKSFCQYVSKSTDNVARGLAAYFTGFRISDESYFQTVACHPEGRHFALHPDALRFNNWNEDHRDEDGRRVDADGNILIHPEPITEKNIPAIMASGALFTRKFEYAVTSMSAYTAIKTELANSENSAERLGRVRARIGLDPSEMSGRDRFCQPDEASRYRRRLAELEETALKAKRGLGTQGISVGPPRTKKKEFGSRRR